jgi:hypothetical protein
VRTYVHRSQPFPSAHTDVPFDDGPVDPDTNLVFQLISDCKAMTRPRTRALLEQAFMQIDCTTMGPWANVAAGGGQFRPQPNGLTAAVTWRRGAWPEDCIQIAYWEPAGSRVRHVQTVPVDFTRPGAGGRRWWFRCPRCQERVGVLYVPVAGWAWSCRRCSQRTYLSQRLGRDGRLALRAFKTVLRAVGPAAQSSHNFPASRPGRMHTKTFARLHQRWWAALASQTREVECVPRSQAANVATPRLPR